MVEIFELKMEDKSEKEEERRVKSKKKKKKNQKGRWYNLPRVRQRENFQGDVRI